MPKPRKVPTSSISDDILMNQKSNLSQTMDDGNGNSALNFCDDQTTNANEEEGNETLKSAFTDHPNSTELSGTKSQAVKKSNYCDYSRSDPVVSQQMASSMKELTFPMKLHKVLSDPQFEHIVTWLSHGRSWKITDEKGFRDNVIPLYFNNCQYSSIVRQVSGWGFKRITKGADFNSYYHELFLRGLPHLCRRMRRLVSNGARKPPSKDQEEEPNFYRISKENPLPKSSSVVSHSEDTLSWPLSTGSVHANNLDSRGMINPSGVHHSHILSQDVSRKTIGHGMDSVTSQDTPLVHLEHPSVYFHHPCQVSSVKRNAASSSRYQEFIDSNRGLSQSTNTYSSFHNNLQLKLLRMHNVSDISQSINGSDGDRQEFTDATTSAVAFSSHNSVGSPGHDSLRRIGISSAYRNGSLEQLRHHGPTSYNAHTLYHRYNTAPSFYPESVMSQVSYANMVNTRNLLDHSYFGATAYGLMSNTGISSKNHVKDNNTLNSPSTDQDDETINLYKNEKRSTR